MKYLLVNEVEDSDMNKYLKKIVTQIFVTTDTNNIIDNVKKYNIVSFDMFDTLITRYVPVSTDLFDVMSIEVKNIIDKDLPDFKKKRIECEKRAVRKKYPLDPTIDEIYDEYKDINEIERKKLISLEEKIEYIFCCPRKEIVDVFNYCIKSGKKVLIISDTPLGENIIKRMLKKCGITGYSSLYLSSKEGHTKYSGELFKWVLRNEKIKSSDIIHIGDSLRSDFFNAKLQSIRSVLINLFKNDSCIAKKSLINLNIDYNILQKFIEVNECKEFSIYEKIGYEILGPLLLAFTWWLNDRIDEKNSKCLFLAREGVILNKAYNFVYPEKENLTEVLRVSRRAITGCSLYNVETINELFNELKTFSLDGITLKELCDLGLIDTSIAENFVSKYHITLEHNLMVNQFVENRDIWQAFNCEIIPVLAGHCKKQREIFIDYLKKKIGLSKSIFLVDVGWRGSMQDKLLKFFPECFNNSSTKGFYYGVQLDSRVDGHSIDNKYGALFVDQGEKSDDYCVISLTGQIFEMLFMDLKYGTTSHYERDKEGVAQPKMHQSEYWGDAEKALGQIQNAAFKFIEEYITSGIYEANIIFGCDAAFQQYKNVFVHPSNSIINSIKCFSTYDVSISRIVSDKSLFYWLFHPSIFFRELKLNHSKSLFLQSVFKIKLPYYEILKLVQKRHC